LKQKHSFQTSEKGHGLARIVIAQDGEPYLELIPHQKERKRHPGRFKGKIKISGDFTETSADVIGSFYGETE
jgi:antitoxin (DNA-binding transcriptional repressor) of toxin-antitoxin stability system